MSIETSTLEIASESETSIALSEAIGFVEGMMAAEHFGDSSNPLYIRMVQMLDRWRVALSEDDPA